MDVSKITLKQSTWRLCQVTASGHIVKCANAVIQGYKPQIVKLSVEEIRTLTARGLKVLEFTQGIQIGNMSVLTPLTYNKVLSDENLKFLSTINHGFIDTNDILWAGPLPKSGAKPAPEVPKNEPVKEEPVVEETPVVEEEPVVEDIAVVAEPEPVHEEVEITPEPDPEPVIVESEPVVEETPNTEDTPAPEVENPEAQSAPRNNRNNRRRNKR